MGTLPDPALVRALGRGSGPVELARQLKQANDAIRALEARVARQEARLKALEQ